MAHIGTVQQLYEAFGKGDVPAILGHLADDVDWEYGGDATGLPWLQARRGPAQVAGFFQDLAALDIQRFQPTTFLESGNVVVVLIQLEVVVRATAGGSSKRTRSTSGTSTTAGRCAGSGTDWTRTGSGWPTRAGRRGATRQRIRKRRSAGPLGGPGCPPCGS